LAVGCQDNQITGEKLQLFLALLPQITNGLISPWL
jgi:hypothetical protein